MNLSSILASSKAGGILGREGCLIYGERDPTLLAALVAVRKEEAKRREFESEPEKLKQAVKSAKTSKQWVLMTSQQRGSFNIEGVGISAMCTILGISNPQGATRAIPGQMEFGEKVWGETDEYITAGKAAAEMGMSYTEERLHEPEKLKAKIKTLFSAHQWANLSQGKRMNEIEGLGMGLYKVARILGFTKKPIYNIENFLEMGELIYGPGTEISTKLEALRTR